MNIQHKKALALTTIMLGIPLSYVLNSSPFLGFLIAFLLAWLAWEDFETMLIDMRVVIAFGSVVVFSRESIISVVTGIIFYLLFQCLFYGLAKFEEYGDENEDISYEDDLCPLQKGCFTGFVPFLALSSWLYLTMNMLFKPFEALQVLASQENVLAQIIVQTHYHFGFLSDKMEQNIWFPIMIVLLLTFAVWALKKRISKKQRTGFVATYPMGDGDPYVLGILAALFGGEIFFYIILMVSLVFGEFYRLYRYFLDWKVAA